MLKRRFLYKKALIVFVLLILLTLGLVANLKAGAIKISWAELISAEGAQQQILFKIRGPRALLSVLVGLNLAMAGAILQGVLRNPIADPSIIGISSGSGLFAVLVMILFPEHTLYVPVVSFFGALMASTTVYLIAWRGGVSPLGLILAGVAVGAFFGAMMTLLMVFHSDKIQGVINWLAGGLQGRSWLHIRMILPYTILGTFLAILLSNRVNILILGDDMAKGLGLSVETNRLMLIAIAALLSASAVCVSGLVGFVGLIAPHIVRILAGGNYRYLIPVSGLTGANLMLWSDLFARITFTPIEIPVGIFMAMLGSPFFIYLLKTNQQKFH